MESPLSNFDIDANYWDVDPQLKAMNPFATMYEEDKGKKKKDSSLKMWAIALFADPKSRFSNLTAHKRQEIIAKDYIKDKVKDFNWKDLETAIDQYKSLYSTQAQRSLADWNDKLRERDLFLKSVPYDLDKGDALDKMLTNTSKLYDLYEKVLERLNEEEAEGVTKGGRTESISEKKLI